MPEIKDPLVFADGTTQISAAPANFTDLGDVPSSYAGAVDRVPRVTAGADGLYFAEAAYPIEVTDGTTAISNITGLQFLNGTVSDPATGVAEYTAPGFANPMTTQDDLIIGGASGAPARLGKGSDGQVLTVDPTTHHLVWATPSGGGAPTDAPYVTTAAVSGLSAEVSRPWLADTYAETYPASPTAYDDEFDDESIDAKWGWTNQGTSSASESGGYLQLTLPSASGNVRLFGQSAPAGAWEIAALISLSRDATNTSDGWAGVWAGESSPGKFLVIGFGCFATNNIGIMSQSWNTPTSWSANAILISGQWARLWLRLVFDGSSTYSTYWSLDGLEWVKTATAAIPGGSMTVGRFGVASANNTGASKTLRVGQFRQIA